MWFTAKSKITLDLRHLFVSALSINKCVCFRGYHRHNSLNVNIYKSFFWHIYWLNILVVLWKQCGTVSAQMLKLGYYGSPSTFLEPN